MKPNSVFFSKETIAALYMYIAALCIEMEVSLFKEKNYSSLWKILY